MIAINGWHAMASCVGEQFCRCGTCHQAEGCDGESDECRELTAETCPWCRESNEGGWHTDCLIEARQEADNQSLSIDEFLLRIWPGAEEKG